MVDATKTEAWNLGRAHSRAGRSDESNSQQTYSERCDYIEGYQVGALEKAYIEGSSTRTTRSDVNLAFLKGVADHDDGMDCCTSQFSTPETCMSYLEGYQTAQREALIQILRP